MEGPKRIGKYELEEFLGGGMSHVYKARDTVIGRTVAVKVLTPAAAADQEAKSRFLREAQMAGSLAHENVMSVYDFGEEQGQPFMVMEFLRGEDLRSAMKNGRTGDLASRLRTALQVAKALEYIHGQRIIHRDIKPENIHINATGTVKLMDFGIAKTEELSLTRPGFTMGTPYYMAPEQVVGRDVTYLADVYAFGILLFELLAGTRPISGDTVEQLFYRVLHEPVDLGPLRQASVPEPVCNLIGRCVAKGAADRPQSFSLLRQEIEKALREIEEPAKPAGAPAGVPARKPATPGRGWILPLAAILVMAAILASYFALRPRPTAEAPAKRVELSPVISTPAGEMVLIQAGRFLSGKNKEPAELPAYYIDRTEVSNEAYARFCRERQRPQPPGVLQDRPDYPVVNITIVDAQEFAKWARMRLPGRLEWEKAARGTDGRPYPWGDSRDPGFANVADNTSLTTHALMPVESFRQGASPYQVLQMAGNAWEFVDDSVTPSPGALRSFAKLLSPPPAADEPWYTIRGGSFDNPLVEDATFEWSAVPARFRAPNIGFRCVKDAR